MAKQALWLEAIEQRIAATTAMLTSMRGVKMTGLTEVLREDLQRLRVEELSVSRKFRKLLIWTMGICQLMQSRNHRKTARLTSSSVLFAAHGTDPHIRRVRNACAKE